MPRWTLVDTHPTHWRTFQRPLDVYEIGFLLDGLFNGTADNLQHFELRLKDSGSRDAQPFSNANIVKAWLSTKRRYPLAGATVRGADRLPLKLAADPDSKSSVDGNVDTGFASEPHFVIRERDLVVLRPHEVVFGWVTCAEEAQRQVTVILDGPRPLSDDLLVQLYVFRETDPKRTNILHLMVLTAHCVTDGIANSTFVRCLLDTLARGDGAEPAQVPLEDRLAMAIASTELEPTHLRSLSPALRRWRRVVGVVIFQLRMAKRQGGHTLPCRLKRSTPYKPARSGLILSSLTPTETANVITNCRLHNLTFGHTYLVLAQVAMTRVLYRRYLHGEMSEEEWEYRKRQPHISGGPLNLRPYLDSAWFERGGGGEFMLSVSVYFYQLPFMTLGETARRRPLVLFNGAPPFSDLLTFDRFLHRSELVKKQATDFFRHPLFFEIMCATSRECIDRTLPGALRWMEHAKTANDHCTHDNPDGNDVLAVSDIPMVWAHGGSSVGSVDLISPAEYPLLPTHPLSPFSSNPHPMKAGYIAPPPPLSSVSEADIMPKIVVEYSRTHLHTRPGELYLGAGSSGGQLRLFIFYDGNVFEEGVVREWLEEVREAVLWYLGQTHRSRQRQQKGGGWTEHIQVKL